MPSKKSSIQGIAPTAPPPPKDLISMFGSYKTLNASRGKWKVLYSCGRCGTQVEFHGEAFCSVMCCSSCGNRMGWEREKVE